ncbi:AI-2E family transporter [Nocardioides sp. YR527]|uniref:AI-2E family transporter n=1 Tax=Nocardioides sp. YR527 TaxID=1881028 RepID=UPI0015A47AEC|nr:AI-2E family transporter [Nocardioides sp. YR527]
MSPRTQSPENTATSWPLQFRVLAVLLGSAAVVILVAGLKAASGIIGPLFLAMVLTIVVHPARNWLAKRLPAGVATALSIIAVVVGIVGLGVCVLLAVARFATLLGTYGDVAAERVDDLTDWLSKVGIGTDEVLKIIESFDLSNLLSLVSGALNGMFGLLSTMVFIIALCLFMAIDATALPRQLDSISRRRPGLVGALSSFSVGTRRYLLVSTVFGLIVAALDTLALYLLGVPAPLVWGLLAFLTNYIPNIGFVIGLIPPAVLALLDGDLSLMLAVIAVYCLLNVVIQSVIQPKVVGEAVGLSVTLTFLSLIFWSWIMGPIGAVMAVPFTLFVRAVFVESDPAKRWLMPLIAGSAPVELLGDGDDLDDVDPQRAE